MLVGRSPFRTTPPALPSPTKTTTAASRGRHAAGSMRARRARDRLNGGEGHGAVALGRRASPSAVPNPIASSAARISAEASAPGCATPRLCATDTKDRRRGRRRCPGCRVLPVGVAPDAPAPVVWAGLALLPKGTRRSLGTGGHTKPGHPSAPRNFGTGCARTGCCRRRHLPPPTSAQRNLR